MATDRWRRRLPPVRRKVRGIARRLVHKLAPGALILLYHRVVDVPSDPHRLCVSPERFAEHLDILRQQTHPMRLEDLDRALADRNVPRRAVVVTLDDGYVDNLVNAKPLLKRYDVPATVFVTSGYVDGGREFWWDELDGLLLQPGALPDSLVLSIDGRDHAWSLGEAARYSRDAALRDRGWAVWQQDAPTPRQHLYRDLYRLVKPLTETERRRVLDELRAWAGDPPRCRPSHRVLSSDEVVELADGGLIEVGAHSVTHPLLPTLSAANQREEIRRSKRDLEDTLGRPVTHFAYPFGERTADTVALVRDAGFTGACALGDAFRRGADRFQLPRLGVNDWDGDGFARRLRGWLLD